MDEMGADRPRTWSQRWCILCPRVQSLLNRLHKKQAQALTCSIWVPLGLLIIAFGIAIFCTTGLANYSIEPRDVQDIWIPSSATILKQKNEFEREFGAYNIERVILTSNSSSDTNIINEEFFADLYRLHQTITRDVEVVVNGESYRFGSLCVQASLGNQTGCYQFSPLAFWAKGVGEYQVPDQISTTLAEPNRTVLNPWTQLDHVVGGISEFTTHEIVNAKAVQLWYFLDNSQEKRSQVPGWSQVISAFEDAIVSTISRSGQFATHYALVMKSFDQEVSYTLAEDMSVFVSLGVMLLIATLGFLSFDLLYRSKVLLGIMSLVFIVTTTSSTIGLATWVGISTAPLTYYIIFLVFALGINHVFLILHAYDRVIERERDAMQDKRITYRQLAIYTLVEVMPSITVAVAFEIIALLSGFFVQLILRGPIAGLHVFVLTAVIGVALDFFFLNCIFVPALMFDIRRMMAERLDVVPCLQSRTPPKRRERALRFLVRKYFIRFISLLPVKIIVVVLAIWIVSLSVFTIGNYGFSTVDFYRQSSLPDSNYVHRFYDKADEYFKIGTWTNIVLKDVDYTSPATNGTIAALMSSLRNSNYIENDSVKNWYWEYLEFLQKNYSLNASSFYGSHDKGQRYIDEWLNTIAGLPYSRNINFDANGLVRIARFIISEKVVSPEDLSTHIETMNKVRDIASAWATDGRQAYAFSPTYLYYSEFQYLTEASLLHVILAITAALFVGLFVLDITGAILVVLCMLIVALGLVGITMHYLSYNFSGETVTVLVMVPILCVEFMFHSAVYFLEGTKVNDDVPNQTRARRLYWMLVDRGTSVACSILVMFCGTLLLFIFATSPVNKNFAALFVSAISLIFYHALFVLPVLLSWIGTVYPPNSTITGYFLEQTGDGDIKPLGTRGPTSMLMSLNWRGGGGGSSYSTESTAINIERERSDSDYPTGKGSEGMTPSFSPSPNVGAILREEEDFTRTVSRIDYGSLNSAIPEEFGDSPSTPW